MLNPRFAKAVTAVRGKLTMKANQYRQALDRGEGKALPFDRVVECNIGNPQALGQKPVTFVRQVLALLDYPQVRVREHVPEHVALALSLSLSAARSTTRRALPHAARARHEPRGEGRASDASPPDAIARAKTLLEKIPGGTGAYSESQGALYVRQAAPSSSASATWIAPGAPESVDPDASPDGRRVRGGQARAPGVPRTADDCILLPIPQRPLYSGSRISAEFGGHLGGTTSRRTAASGRSTPTRSAARRRARAKGLSPPPRSS